MADRVASGVPGISRVVPDAVRRGGRLRVGTVALIAGLVSLLSGSLLAFWWHRQLEAELGIRPPVLILDLSAAVRAADPAQLPALVRAYTQAAERLAARGVLVLERNAVLAAPPELLVREAEVPREP